MAAVEREHTFGKVIPNEEPLALLNRETPACKKTQIEVLPVSEDTLRRVHTQCARKTSVMVKPQFLNIPLCCF